MGLIHIFHTIADNIVDDLLHLLRICDHHRIRRYQIGIVELDIFVFQIHAHFFHAVPKIVSYIDAVEIVRDTVVFDIGIGGQLIDQLLHIVSLIIYGFDIFIHLFRRICHAVHNSLHITLDGRDRSFQIMGNIAHKLSVLLFMKGRLLLGLFQPKPHILVIAVQIPNLSLGVRLHGIVIIAFLDLLHGNIQLVDGIKHALMDPLCQHQAGKDQDQEDCNEHVNQKLPGYERIDLCHHKHTALGTVRKSKVNLLYIFLQIIIIIAAVAVLCVSFSIWRQLFKDHLCCLFIACIVNRIILTHQDVCGFSGNLVVHHCKIGLVLQLGRILLCLAKKLVISLVRRGHKGLHGLRHHGIIQLLHGIALLGIHQIDPYGKKS